MEPAPDLAIDYEKLKIQEKILFFDEVRFSSSYPLFEGFNLDLLRLSSMRTSWMTTVAQSSV